MFAGTTADFSTAYQFNCAQRSHANFIENHSSVLGALLISGLRYPLTAAVMGAGWSVSRYLYMVGYCKPTMEGNGKGRYNGITHMLFQMALYVTTMMVGYNMVMSQ